LRPGDAATLCPEASGSTLFPCAERSDSRGWSCSIWRLARR
jgi:hypothetical protein